MSLSRSLALFHVKHFLFSRFLIEFQRWDLVTNLSLPRQWRSYGTGMCWIALNSGVFSPQTSRWVDLRIWRRFPGLILAIPSFAKRRAYAHLIESNRKKASFFANDDRASLQLPATVHAQRIEGARAKIRIRLRR